MAVDEATLQSVIEMRENPCHEVRALISCMTVTQVLTMPHKFPNQLAQIKGSLVYLDKTFLWKQAEFPPSISKRIDALFAQNVEAKKAVVAGAGEAGDAASKSSKGSKPK